MGLFDTLSQHDHEIAYKSMETVGILSLEDHACMLLC